MPIKKFQASKYKEKAKELLRKGESPENIATILPLSVRTIYRYLTEVQKEEKMRSIELAQTCDICGDKLETPFMKFDHLKEKHPDIANFIERKRASGIYTETRRTKYYCRLCPFSYASIPLAIKHVTGHHLGKTSESLSPTSQVRSGIGLWEGNCPACGQTIFSPPGVTKIKCPKCDKVLERVTKKKAEAGAEAGDEIQESLDFLNKFIMSLTVISTHIKLLKEDNLRLLAENKKLLENKARIQSILSQPS